MPSTRVFAIRTKKWKYIYFRKKEDFDELYDIIEDPEETKNLAKEPKYKNTLLELRQKIFDWMFDTQNVPTGFKYPPGPEGFDMMHNEKDYPESREKDGTKYTDL